MFYDLLSEYPFFPTVAMETGEDYLPTESFKSAPAGYPVDEGQEPNGGDQDAVAGERH
jgi:hypothetical protein